MDPGAQAKRRRTLERVAYYLLGVAIGLVLLGIYWSGRQQSVQRHQAQQQAAERASPDQP